MTDRELLEMAAKAAGFDLDVCQNTGRFAVRDMHGGASYWNPLTDDGDALRLAVKLGLEVSVSRLADRSFASRFGGRNEVDEHHSASDQYAATRRAIVRAAAEIGKVSPKPTGAAGA